MKAHTDNWVAMEDEDDEGEEEMDGEEVPSGEEEDEETDIQSNGKEVEVFELFQSTLSYVLSYPEGIKVALDLECFFEHSKKPSKEQTHSKKHS